MPSNRIRHRKETVHEWLIHDVTGRIRYRSVAVIGDDAVVGYAVSVHETRDPEGRSLAADGDRWVGICAVRLYPETRQTLSPHHGDTPRHPFHVSRARHSSPIRLAVYENGHALVDGHMYAYASTGLTDQWDGRQYLARVNHDFVQFAWPRDRIAVHFGFDRIIPKCFFRVHQGLVYGISHGNNTWKIGERHTIRTFFAIDQCRISD